MDGFILKILTGPQSGAEVALAAGEYVIGSGEDDDLQFNDLSVEPGHAKLRVSEKAVEISCGSGTISSTNGLDLSTDEEEWREVEQLDVLSIGMVRFAIGAKGANWTSIIDALSENTSAGNAEKPLAGSKKEKQNHRQGYLSKALFGGSIRRRVILASTAFVTIFLALTITAPVLRDSSNVVVRTDPQLDFSAVSEAITNLEFVDSIEVRQEVDGEIFVTGYVETMAERRAVLNAVSDTGIPAKIRIWVLAVIRNSIASLHETIGGNLDLILSKSGDLTISGTILDDKEAERTVSLFRDQIIGLNEVHSQIRTAEYFLREVNDLAARTRINDTVAFRFEKGLIEASGVITVDKIDLWAGFLESYIRNFSQTIPMRSYVQLASRPDAALPPIIAQFSPPIENDAVGRPQEIPAEPVGTENPSDNRLPEIAADNRLPEIAADNGLPEIAADNRLPETAADNRLPEIAADDGLPETAAGLPEIVINDNHTRASEEKMAPQPEATDGSTQFYKPAFTEQLEIGGESGIAKAEKFPVEQHSRKNTEGPAIAAGLMPLTLENRLHLASIANPPDNPTIDSMVRPILIGQTTSSDERALDPGLFLSGKFDIADLFVETTASLSDDAKTTPMEYAANTSDAPPYESFPLSLAANNRDKSRPEPPVVGNMRIAATGPNNGATATGERRGDPGLRDSALGEYLAGLQLSMPHCRAPGGYSVRKIGPEPFALSEDPRLSPQTTFQLSTGYVNLVHLTRGVLAAQLGDRLTGERTRPKGIADLGKAIERVTRSWAEAEMNIDYGSLTDRTAIDRVTNRLLEKTNLCEPTPDACWPGSKLNRGNIAATLFWLDVLAVSDVMTLAGFQLQNQMILLEGGLNPKRTAECSTRFLGDFDIARLSSYLLDSQHTDYGAQQLTRPLSRVRMNISGANISEDPFIQTASGEKFGVGSAPSSQDRILQISEYGTVFRVGNNLAVAIYNPDLTWYFGR